MELLSGVAVVILHCLRIGLAFVLSVPVKEGAMPGKTQLSIC